MADSLMSGPAGLRPIGRLARIPSAVETLNRAGRVRRLVNLVQVHGGTAMAHAHLRVPLNISDKDLIDGLTKLVLTPYLINHLHVAPQVAERTARLAAEGIVRNAAMCNKRYVVSEFSNTIQLGGPSLEYCKDFADALKDIVEISYYDPSDPTQGPKERGLLDASKLKVGRLWAAVLSVMHGGEIPNDDVNTANAVAGIRG
jgi:hypothetical protein